MKLQLRSWNSRKKRMEYPMGDYHNFPLHLSVVKSGLRLNPSLLWMVNTNMLDYFKRYIWENDILEIIWNDGMGEKMTRGVIIYNPEKGMFMVEDFKREDFPICSYMTYVVIGNIHQNPEMLQQIKAD